MKTPVFCLALLLSFPAYGQVFATPEQEIADLKTQAVNMQNALDALTQRVTAAEAGLAAVQLDDTGYHDIWHVNRLPRGADNQCTMLLADVTVECPANITDWEGDETDVATSCTSGSHDGTTYTAAEVSLAGEPHRCHFMAADPRWPYATHNSVVTITVE